MAGPKSLTRDDLAKFLPDQRSIRAFEQLFDLIPSEIVDLVLTAGIADSKATNALAVADGIKKLAELVALAPVPQQHNSVNTDYVEFNKFANHELSPAQMGWGTENGTLEIGMGYDAVIQHVGLESYYRIKATADISKGDCVMFTGAVGASGVVTGAPASGITDGQFIMGVATMDIANNEFGYVNHFGVVRGFRTNGASVGETWNDGDILWYNPSYPGGLTNVQPAAPTPEIIVAVVITASSGNNGSVLVRPTFMPRLDQLTGVDITSPTADDLLQYDGTNWVNRSGLFTNIYDNGTESTRVATGTTGQRPASAVVGDIRFNTTDSKLEFYNGTDWCQISCPSSTVSATGGTETTITDGGVTYRVHTFTSSGTFTVTNGGEVEYLVIGGGGAGGTSGGRGGGGGAGGYRSSVVGESSGGGAPAEPKLTVFSGAYTVTVGAGAPTNTTADTQGADGSDSVFSTIIAKGGGGGGGYSVGSTADGRSGGSGGGGATIKSTLSSGGTGTANQGYNGGGGIYSGSLYGAGGGGGAGQAGANGTTSKAGDGGDGVASSITGSSVIRAGGGGGGESLASAGLGGLGGGGNGYTGSTNPTAGTANTGSGGGGGASIGAAGGSGIVIIRYPI